MGITDFNILQWVSYFLFRIRTLYARCTLYMLCTLCTLYVLFLCFSPSYVEAGNLDVLERVLLKYRQEIPLKIITERKVELKFFQQVKTYKGNLLLGKGRFRWENHYPHKSIWIFTGTLFWDLQFENPKSQKPIQIVKKEIKKSKEGHLLISILKGNLQKTFKVHLHKREGNVLTYSLDSRKKTANSLSLMKNIHVHIHSKKKKLTLLSYEDDIGNKTRLYLKETRFNVKIKKGVFSYRPPKGVSVLSL